MAAEHLRPIHDNVRSIPGLRQLRSLGDSEAGLVAAENQNGIRFPGPIVLDQRTAEGGQ